MQSLAVHQPTAHAPNVPLSTSGQIRALISRIQVNNLGLPEGIYRPDLLPAYPTHTPQNEPTQPQAEAADGLKSPIVAGGELVPLESEADQLYHAQLIQYERDIKAAFIPLDYAEGYPTLDGMPVWAQFIFEPSDAYALYTAYMSQGNKGARQLNQVIDDPVVQTLPIKPTMAQLEELFHTYYWNIRAKAADMFYAAHRRKERERRAYETEDEHYKFASRLMGICEMYLDDNTDELIETMTPKAFIEFLKAATQLQRISTGLNAAGPGSGTHDAIHGQSTEVIMRTIAEKSAGGNPQLASEELAQRDADMAGNASKLAQILSDPRLTHLAQEIVLRTTTITTNNGGI